MVKFTYLIINFLTILVPFIYSFDKRMNFYSRWRFFLPGLLFTAIFFLVWDWYFIRSGIWSFNDKYITGIKFQNIPLEEYLFFFTVPYACVFIYDSLQFFKWKFRLPDTTKPILRILGLLMFIGSFFLLHRAYTFSVLSIWGLVLPAATFILTLEQLDRFLRMYLISLIPMFIVNGLLTALPVVIYNDAQNLSVRIGTIPVEDFLYSAILLIMNVTLYEWSRNRFNTLARG